MILFKRSNSERWNLFFNHIDASITAGNYRTIHRYLKDYRTLTWVREGI
jgi:hypothetical protein